MKKLLIIILLYSLSKATSAQDVWQMYPIQVNYIQLPSADYYFTYSCYDSILQVTVVDSTPVYPYYIMYNTNYGMLAYYMHYNDYLYIVVYDINNHVFLHDSVSMETMCGSVVTLYGNSAEFYSCNSAGNNETETLIFADIVNSSLNPFTYGVIDAFGFYAYFSNGWFVDFEGGSQILQIEDTRSFECVQKGMYGSGGYIYSNYGNVNVNDGILVASDNGYVQFRSNDSCSIFGSGNFVYQTKNGLAYGGDSLKIRLGADDPFINQWTTKTLYQPYDTAHSTVLLKDRVFAFAVNKDTVATVYCAAYNIHTHQWITDSIQSNKAIGLAINNGTVSWTDSSGTSFMRGYSDSLGWGNFTTPLDIDFYLENYQSPTNGNLIYVRNMTIGSDNTTIDFGDGITTPLKSQSHLYKNPNGTYRTSSTTFSYDVCIYALGQSSCKTVTFTNTVGTTNLPKDNKLINLRYAMEPGKFIIDNQTKRPLEITVTNMLGQEIKKFNCDGAHQSFSLEQHSQGVYVLTAKVEGERIKQSLKLVNGK